MERGKEGAAGAAAVADARARRYRAGYTAEERRAVEGSLLQGRLRGVCATNALELGIDVGALDVTLHLGFPGNVASLWQQAGRAGRREQQALSILIAFDGPFDQYFVRHPKRLFERPLERASIDPTNRQIMQQHCACAAFELPLDPRPGGADAAFFGASLQREAAACFKRGELGKNPEMPSEANLRYIGELRGGPAKGISLRAIDEEIYQVFEEGTGKLVEEVEASKAFFQVYEGAIYMNQGHKFLCLKLDMDNQTATVRKSSVGYYTSVVEFKDIEVMGGNKAYDNHVVAARELEAGGSTAQVAPARYVAHITAFNKFWLRTGEMFDTVKVNLPPTTYDTFATWIKVPDAVKAAVRREDREFKAGLHAAGHALLNVLPLYILCNPEDVGCECANKYETRYKPSRVLLYDKQPGGTGISSQVRPIFGNLLEAARDLIKGCECDEPTGCPSCCHHTDCNQYNAVLDKRAALMVLEGTLAAQREEEEEGGDGAVNCLPCADQGAFFPGSPIRHVR